MRRTRVMLFSLLTVVALAPTAYAQSVTGSGYGGVAGDVQDQVGDDGLAGAQVVETLPFTGVDLVLVVGGALMLLLLGLVVRRRARTDA
jgi:hypothetical protein